MLFDKVMIFGGTGSLGTNIIKKWNFANKFIVYSRDEFKQWKLKQSFPDVKFILGDISDYEKIKNAIMKEQPSLIIIASAMKHIDKCQTYVKECLSTNVIGLLNVLNAVEELHFSNLSKYLRKIVFVSTDKACEPITIYGMSKAISEHIVQTREFQVPNVDVVAVRYGNVVNSNGSIIPIFKQQQECLTVTHPGMTRFYMTLDQSVDLIEDAVNYGKNKEIWIPKLDSMKIMDLASIFSEKYNLEIKIIGLRCREKIHEALISSEEIDRVSEFETTRGLRFVIHNDNVQTKSQLISNYTSEYNIIEKEKLKELLREYI